MSVIDLEDSASLPDAVSERAHAPSGVRRFRWVCAVVVVAAAIPYTWVLWDLWTGTINVLRVNPADDIPIYDVQARAIMHGHLSLPHGSISVEAFVHDGRQYTYFGILPSLLRIPFFLFTNSLDGRFTALSMFGAWVVAAVFSCLLLWRLRVLLRGDVLLGWFEAVSYGLFLASVLVGSVLLYLASNPDVYAEDEAWSIALACASLFALVGVLERPSWRRVIVCGLLVLLTNLNRATTGYAAVLASLLIATWFALGRAGPDRRRWALPMALAGLVPMAIGCSIDFAKFDVLFGVPFSDYELGRLYFGNANQYFSLRYLPSTLQAYVDPLNFRVTSIFPYITLPDNPGKIAHTALFTRTPTANAEVSMPLLFVSGVWGVVAAFWPGRSRELRALRILIVTSAVTAGAVMIYGWILERFVADFMPLLILAGMIGMVEIWRRLDRMSRAMKLGVVAGVGALAFFGLVANVGYAVTPVHGWTQTQLRNYVETQQKFSNVTGHPLEHHVVRSPASCGTGESGRTRPPIYCGPPLGVPMGTLYVEGDCSKLYIADEAVPLTYYVSEFWLLVERAPDTALCHSLVGTRQPRPA